MGLEEFKTDNTEKSYHDNPKLDKQRLHKDSMCPDCGYEGEHIRGMEWRCTTPPDECDVLTFYKPEKIID